MLKNSKIIVILLIITCIINKCLATTIQTNIAVAANFLITTQKICYFFEKKYKKSKVIISSDSTANLFTKIKNTAPFNIFISADKKHAKIIEKSNFYKNKTKTYAIGKISLNKNNKNIKKQELKYIKKEKFLTISNPKLSPYGKSSKLFLTNLNIKHEKIILGANVNHTFSFIKNNTCNIGITSFSQNIQNKTTYKTYWKIPKYLHKKIKQKTILIKNDKNNVSKTFLKYMEKEKIKKFIKKNGYK